MTDTDFNQRLTKIEKQLKGILERVVVLENRLSKVSTKPTRSKKKKPINEMSLGELMADGKILKDKYN